MPQRSFHTGRHSSPLHGTTRLGQVNTIKIYVGLAYVFQSLSPCRNSRGQTVPIGSHSTPHINKCCNASKAYSNKITSDAMFGHSWSFGTSTRSDSLQRPVPMQITPIAFDPHV
eukprot:1022516-Amphidinium_carterae.2